MPRGLRPVFFALFLAAAAAASAGPDDLFDARLPGALRPGQKEVLLALENGRYTLQDGHFRDARAADPRRPLLTNARVAELLAVQSPGGRTPLDAFRTAAGDEARQWALARVPKGSPARLNFDGGAARAGTVPNPPGSGAGGAPDPAVLQARLIQRLVFKGTKREREALGEAISLIIQTRTGRELAARFVREGAAAEVTMAVLDNAGQTDTDAKPPKVTLSREYLGTDPDHNRVAMAGTLAHELFGHAAEKQRAAKAGFPEVAHDHYRGDEICSRLIDWLVQTELTGKVADESPNEYLDDPEGYYRGLVTRDPYYVVTLSPTEMKNPVTTLRGRRRLLAADAARTAEEIKDTELWRPIAAHFITVHRVAKTRLAPAEKEIDDFVEWAAGHQKKLAASKAALEGQIKHWTSPAGAKEKAELIAAADSLYLKGLEAVLAERTRALRRLRADPRHGRDPASASELVMPDLVVTAPRTGGPPIDLDELGRMYEQDKKKNPGHWK